MDDKKVREIVLSKVDPLLKAEYHRGFLDGVESVLSHLPGEDVKPAAKPKPARKTPRKAAKKPAQRVAKRPLVCEVIADLVNTRETVDKDQVLEVAMDRHEAVTKHDVANALGHMVKQGVIVSRDPGVYARASMNGAA